MHWKYRSFQITPGVGVAVGWGVEVGVKVGVGVGSAVGVAGGSAVGSIVGSAVGSAVGVAVGAAVGSLVGSDVGVGSSVGSGVGVGVSPMFMYTSAGVWVSLPVEEAVYLLIRSLYVPAPGYSVVVGAPTLAVTVAVTVPSDPIVTG